MSIYKNGKLIAGGRQCMPLLSFMWSDHILNDVSWLRADTYSWQSGAVYQAAYQHLEDEYNALSTTSSTDFDYNDNTYVRFPAEDHLSDSHPYAYANIYSYPVNIVYADEDYISMSGSDIYNGSGSSATNLGTVTGISTLTYRMPLLETVAGIKIMYYVAQDGHKIVLSEMESAVAAIYAATGVAWYYILDTVNQRFKLPRTKWGMTGLRGNVGDYVEAGLPNITGTFRATLNTSYDADDTGVFSRGSNLGAQKTSLKDSYTYNNYKHTFDASNSNSIYGNSTTVQPKATEMYLYFYVGNFTQTAIENTAGLNAELFNEKADITAIPDLVEPIITPDYDNITTITNGTTYLADKTYLAILGSGSGSQAHVDISKNSDMSSPITIVQIYITSSGNIYFMSTGIIPKGWYYKATNGSTKIVPIG